MTPEERALVAELFDRLATLEDAQRDPEAERLIKDGLRQAPNAVYALAQSVLVQDEALKRADARIRALEQELGPAEPPRQGGFLDNMRGTLFGRREEPPRSGSVPSVPPVRQGDTPWGTAPGYAAGAPGGAPSGYSGGPPGGYPGPGGAPPMGAEPGRPGGSFLGTMAASAAGVIGGSMLLSGIRSMMGGQSPGGHSAFDQASAGTHTPSSPGSDVSGGKLAQDAGLGDIGRRPSASDAGGSSDGGDDGSGRGLGMFDNADDNDAGQEDDFGDDMDDGDFGGDDGEE